MFSLHFLPSFLPSFHFTSTNSFATILNAAVKNSAPRNSDIKAPPFFIIYPPPPPPPRPPPRPPILGGSERRPEEQKVGAGEEFPECRIRFRFPTPRAARVERINELARRFITQHQPTHRRGSNQQKIILTSHRPSATHPIKNHSRESFTYETRRLHTHTHTHTHSYIKQRRMLIKRLLLTPLQLTNKPKLI